MLSTKHIHVQLDGGCGMVNAYGGLSLKQDTCLKEVAFNFMGDKC